MHRGFRETTHQVQRKSAVQVKITDIFLGLKKFLSIFVAVSHKAHLRSGDYFLKNNQAYASLAQLARARDL